MSDRMADPIIVQELEQGLALTLSMLPVGGNLPPDVDPAVTFAGMHDHDPIHLLCGLQRIAWAAVEIRSIHERQRTADTVREMRA